MAVGGGPDAGRSAAQSPVPLRLSGRRKYLVLAALLVVLAVVGVVVASQSSPSSVSGSVDVSHLPVGPPAPALTQAKGWLNSPPLTATALRGKVVLYDFWTYSCVNCVRTIPHLSAWAQRYGPDGLVVVGVHSPEFDFEKDHGNVAAAVSRLHVAYPVALDDNMDVWNAFGTQYWPEEWVADRHGDLRYQSIGEGDYTQTEDAIRVLLGVNPRSPRARVTTSGTLGQPGGHVTPETYLGLMRGVAGAQPGTVDYPDVRNLPADTARLVGPWNAGDQLVQSTAPGAAVVLHYRARAANLVMAVAPGAGPIQVQVTLDGHPLPPSDRTTETQVDPSGHTFVTVSTPDLYRVVLSPRLGDHTVRLTALAPGLQAFAFTFGA